jgi:hypothetical protein
MFESSRKLLWFVCFAELFGQLDTSKMRAKPKIAVFSGKTAIAFEMSDYLQVKFYRFSKILPIFKKRT